MCLLSTTIAAYPCAIPELWYLGCAQSRKAVSRAAAKLRGLPTSHCLLDNAESCLQGQCAMSFRQLLVKVRACPNGPCHLVSHSPFVGCSTAAGCGPLPPAAHHLSCPVAH